MAITLKKSDPLIQQPSSSPAKGGVLCTLLPPMLECWWLSLVLVTVDVYRCYEFMSSSGMGCPGKRFAHHPYRSSRSSPHLTLCFLERSTTDVLFSAEYLRDTYSRWPQQQPRFCSLSRIILTDGCKHQHLESRLAECPGKTAAAIP